MGRIISIEDWRARHDRPKSTTHPAGTGRSAGDPVARLERAVARLEPLLDEVVRGGGPTRAQVETELLAVSGAVSLQMYGDAAARVERLATRLARLHRQPRELAD